MSKELLENNLNCDFPARESFREALLARLLAMDEDDLRQASIEGQGEVIEEMPRSAKLSNFDLEWVAAAQGDQADWDNPIEE